MLDFVYLTHDAHEFRVLQKSQICWLYVAGPQAKFILLGFGWLVCWFVGGLFAGLFAWIPNEDTRPVHTHQFIEGPHNQPNDGPNDQPCNG